MNWKQFLKPDWRKITIVVILVLIGFFSVQNCAPRGKSYPLILFPFYFYEGYQNMVSNCSVDFIPAITSVIYWYILSCIIIWLYDKFRKRK